MNVICSECDAEDFADCYDDCQCRWCLLYDQEGDELDRFAQQQKERQRMKVDGAGVKMLAKIIAKVKR